MSRRSAAASRRSSARAAPARFNLGVLSLAGDHVWEADSEGLYPLADLCDAARRGGGVGRGRCGTAEARRADHDPRRRPFAAAQPDRRAFNGPTTMPAIDLIALAVQHGDNTAADVIMSRIGGPGAVGGWLQTKEIVGLRVDRYAREVATSMLGMPSFPPGLAHAGGVRRGAGAGAARLARGGGAGLPARPAGHHHRAGGPELPQPAVGRAAAFAGVDPTAARPDDAVGRAGRRPRGRGPPPEPAWRARWPIPAAISA